LPRDLQRTKASADNLDGINEFASESSKRERVTKEVTTPDFITPGSWAVDKRSSSGPRIPAFKVENTDDEILVKFLEAGPFAPIFQHWLMINGKRSPYVCIVKECPLCARGDKPKSSDWFNVIDLSGDEPALKVWYASPDPAKAIKLRAENKRTSPINKEALYFVVSKAKGKNDIAEYSLDPVREDELGDWNVAPLTEAQIEVFNSQKYDASLVKALSRSELAEVAKQHLSED
jgi:hypothetical protein